MLLDARAMATDPNLHRSMQPAALTPRLVAVLAMMCAVTPLSIDMYLPALPQLAIDYGVPRGDVQLTLSAFMIAFGCGQIIYGPLGDHFGRRPVLLTGVLLYVGTSISCALAQTVEQLGVLRFLQGLAACAVPAMARAIVRDLADRNRAAAALSTIMASVSVAPMIAPFIGANVLEISGWRTIFLVLGGFGLIAAVAAWAGAPESLRPELRGPLAFRAVLSRYGELLRSPRFMGYALTSAFMFCCMFSFISGSPFVLIDVYGLSPRTYSYCFGANVIALSCGAVLNSRLARRVGSETILKRALWLPASVAVILLVLGVIEHETGRIGIWPFIPIFVLQIAGLSLVSPNATAGALQHYPHMAGVASSLMGVIQFGLAALFGAIVGQLIGQSLLPMIVLMATGGVASVIAYWLLVRPG